MATTYKLIDKTILTGSQTSVSFTGLGSYSSDYTDLLVRVSGRTDRSATFDNLNIGFNSSTSNFSGRVLVGYGSSGYESGTATGLIASINSATSTSNTFTSADTYIPNYSSSNYKSFSSDATNENNDGFAVAFLGAGLWSDTSAITSIQLYPVYGANFVSGSSFYLYGIKNS